MKKRRRLLGDQSDEDPMSGLTNLFDLGMVLAVALMVALVSRHQMTEMLTNEDYTIVKNPGEENMEIIKKEGSTIEKYKGSRGSSNSEGNGKKVGSAYQLESGEIIYIPE